jgi:hypothetical protein
LRIFSVLVVSFRCILYIVLYYQRIRTIPLYLSFYAFLWLSRRTSHYRDLIRFPYWNAYQFSHSYRSLVKSRTNDVPVISYLRLSPTRKRTFRSLVFLTFLKAELSFDSVFRREPFCFSLCQPRWTLTSNISRPNVRENENANVASLPDTQIKLARLLPQFPELLGVPEEDFRVWCLRSWAPWQLSQVFFLS